MPLVVILEAFPPNRPGRNLFARFPLVASSFPGRLFPLVSLTQPRPHRGAAESSSKFQPAEPPKSSRAPGAAGSRGLGDPEGSGSSGAGAAGSGGKQAPVVAKSSASGAAAVAGLAAMITRSKLVEQLRDYQIRSQHK